MDTVQFRKSVERERKRQIEKWGSEPKPDSTWMDILEEELKEAEQACKVGSGYQILTELVQCAAVIEAWATERIPRSDENDRSRYPV